MRTLDDLDVAGKTVLLRVDLNVPMQAGRVTDTTRIERILPTLQYLIKKKSRIVLLSHFDRPGGKFVPSMSLAPLVDAVSKALHGKEVKFGVDCVGPAAKEAVDKLKDGEVLLLENLRFHAEEEKGGKEFAKQLAYLGDAYVNDAFSCSHRAHASITAITEFLPSAAGLLMQQEVGVLTELFSTAKKPIGAVIGGSKVSTKLELLNHLIKTMDVIVIGGAMANTFLCAKGYKVGKSLCEPKLNATALKILAAAAKNKCKILLPIDFVVADAFAPQSPCKVVPADEIPDNRIAIDVGPDTVSEFAAALTTCKTVVWNGPLGAFETSPFDVGTVSLARTVAALTAKKKIRSIGGGGDTVSAISHSGLTESFSYVSTAGGAFLEWLEGKTLPGVAALMIKSASRRAGVKARR
ncbi:MAG: phosphoglycerate kinase [Rickettsiales bacterium]|nr:phosphoglycerate kinase [Rickettsiales bacterium]